MKTKNFKAFTLIEILIVIAIIGILAGIVLVSLSFARQKAKDAAAMSMAESLGKALHVCDMTSTYVPDAVGKDTTCYKPSGCVAVPNEMAQCFRCIDPTIMPPSVVTGPSICTAMLNSKYPDFTPTGWQYSSLVWGYFGGSTLHYLRIINSASTKQIECSDASGGPSGSTMQCNESPYP